MLSVEDGLPSGLIFDATQDKDGFMWFATANGLCRYDGHSFKIYNTNNSPLLSNAITGVVTDANNHLLIQTTQNFGSTIPVNLIQVLDLNSYRFIQMDEALPDIPFKSDTMDAMFHDGSGNIYFFANQYTQLWQYRADASFILRMNFKHIPKKIFNYLPPFAFIKTRHNCIYIISRYESKNYFIFPDTTLLIEKPEYYPMAITPDNEFIIYNMASKDYFLLNASGKKRDIFFSQKKLNLPDLTLYSFDDFSMLFKTEQNQYYLKMENQWFEIFNSADQKNIPEFAVISYMKDRNGNFWLCTEIGIYQVNIRKSQFEHIFPSKKNNPVINNAVRSIYVDYLKTTGRRVFAMVNYELMVKEKDEKRYPDVGCVTLLKKNDCLYMAGNPLRVYHQATGKIQKLNPFTYIGDVWSITDFSDSVILIGGSSNIVAYHIYSGLTNTISYSNQNISQPMNVYRIIKTKAKGWVAVAENGIYFINDQCIVYDYYSKQQTDPEKRLPYIGIFDLYEDASGTAWMAMNGEGLIRWNWNATHPMASDNFKRFTSENGLPDNILYRIEEDNTNQLWISSYSGLVKFNKNNFSTQIYRTKDGLVNAEFNRISSFKDAKGRMYFGGQKGIDSFEPDSLSAEKNTQAISFRLVGLTKFSSEKDTVTDLTGNYLHHTDIVMKPGDHSLTISFSLLDFQDRPHRYAYKIDGLDKDWNYMNENVVRISRLPYGKQNIRIKAQLESGNWSNQEILIPVMVLKPYYLQTWFFVSLFTLLLFVFILIYLLRVNKLQNDKNRLESLVQKRTNSLSEALEDREMLLKEIHHRVKNNLQVITGILQLQKDELKDEATQAAFSEAQSRVSSIALIHQNLYQKKDLGNIGFKTFLHDLSKHVAELYENENRKLSIELNPDELFIDIDTAVPLGLIVNELLTNTYKYAFSNHEDVKVRISLVQTEKGNYQMMYHDNGPGLKENPDFNNAKTLGMHLIGGLAKQISGSAMYRYDQGSTFIIHFKDAVWRKMET